VSHLKVLITSSCCWPEGAGTAPYLIGLADYLSSRERVAVIAEGFRAYFEVGA
jgi:hypothetical protein